MDTTNILPASKGDLSRFLLYTDKKQLTSILDDLSSDVIWNRNIPALLAENKQISLLDHILKTKSINIENPDNYNIQRLISEVIRNIPEYIPKLLEYKNIRIAPNYVPHWMEKYTMYEMLKFIPVETKITKWDFIGMVWPWLNRYKNDPLTYGLDRIKSYVNNMKFPNSEDMIAYIMETYKIDPEWLDPSTNVEKVNQLPLDVNLFPYIPNLEYYAQDLYYYLNDDSEESVYLKSHFPYLKEWKDFGKIPENIDKKLLVNKDYEYEYQLPTLKVNIVRYKPLNLIYEYLDNIVKNSDITEELYNNFHIREIIDEDEDVLPQFKEIFNRYSQHINFKDVLETEINNWYEYEGRTTADNIASMVISKLHKYISLVPNISEEKLKVFEDLISEANDEDEKRELIRQLGEDLDINLI